MGLILGSLQAGLWILLSHLGWTDTPISLLIVAIGAWITGGIHLDGLMDTADGIAAGKEKCLAAMRDSRVGASGVLALTINVLIQIAALIKLSHLSPFALPIATFWGRCAPLWAIGYFPYLYQKENASFHHHHWKGWGEAKPALLLLIIALIITIFTPLKIGSGYLFSVCILIGIVPTLIVPHLLGRRLGGHSGDTYGASLVIVETITLLLLAVLLPVI